MDDLMHPHATVDSNNPPRIKNGLFLGLLAGPYRKVGDVTKRFRAWVLNEYERPTSLDRFCLIFPFARVSADFSPCRHAVEIA
ncbi:hypothetical protein [Burkholderia sp.]|uniref:hypothetical protein n=1 Tax=Burkholderia sp. TaxID=36773 RepID=UPI00258C73C8|nr:hypothetical protein [Burkholderia sp.]MCL4634398.1 hypothetical protein [Burkholderia sp.]